MIKKIGASIGAVIGINIIFTIFATLVLTFVTGGLIESTGMLALSAKYIPWYQNLYLINFASGSPMSFISLSLTNEDIILFVSSNIIYIGLLIYGGYLVFKRSDLK